MPLKSECFHVGLFPRFSNLKSFFYWKLCRRYHRIQRFLHDTFNKKTAKRQKDEIQVIGRAGGAEGEDLMERHNKKEAHELRGTQRSYNRKDETC